MGIEMKTKTIHLEKNLVASTVEFLQIEVEELYEQGVTEITLDLEKVGIVDSTGIGFMIRIQNTLEKDGGRLILVNVHEDIKRMLQIMRLNQHITIE